MKEATEEKTFKKKLTSVISDVTLVNVAKTTT